MTKKGKRRLLKLMQDTNSSYFGYHSYKLDKELNSAKDANQDIREGNKDEQYHKEQREQKEREREEKVRKEHAIKEGRRKKVGRQVSARQNSSTQGS